MGLNKEMKKVLEFISKKLAKKQKKKVKKAKKAKQAKGVSLAEYAKNKMLLDMQSKMATGGGAPITKLTANLDTESMKRDMQELKEKNKDQQKEQMKVANDLSRAVSGIEQYKEQLRLEHEQRANPREVWGPLLMEDDLPIVVELKNKLLLLENEQDRANIEKQIAIDDDDKPRIEHFIKQEVDIVSAITKEKKLLASARKKAKEMTEEQLMKQQQAAFNRARRDAENEPDENFAPSRADAPSKVKVRPKNPVGRPPVGSKAFLGSKMDRATDAADVDPLADLEERLAQHERDNVLGHI
jgi:hypothetical protein